MVSIKIYPARVRNKIDSRLMGHFVEQFPGNIPNGIYDPQSAHADADGFRTDILEKMRETGVTQIRWAGNFSSHYHWMDGVGPAGQRPKKLNFAWDALEDNRHGTAEFIALCKKVGAEPVIGVNMGSGTPEEAMNWVEYCNGTQDTAYANLRRSHGYEEPFGVQYWCLGNEMYAQWQFGHMDAAEYAKKAVHFAYAMRRADPGIHLTAVGLETDPEWNYEVVRRLSVKQVPYAPNAGEYIDYLSAHYYPIGNDSAFTDTDYRTRMAMGAYFHERTRLMRNAIENAEDDSESPIKIVWDEWNPVGEKDGSEFTLEMALWSGLILNSFIRDSKYVKMANYTFAVGGNGPIQPMGDELLLQPEFYLLKLYAGHLGDELVESICSGPSVTVDMPVDRRWPVYGRRKSKKREVPLLDVAATRKGNEITVFVINLSREEDIEARLDIREMPGRITEARVYTIWNECLRATNTLERTEVKIQEYEPAPCGRTLCWSFRRHSINAVVFQMGEMRERE